MRGQKVRRPGPGICLSPQWSSAAIFFLGLFLVLAVLFPGSRLFASASGIKSSQDVLYVDPDLILTTTEDVPPRTVSSLVRRARALAGTEEVKAQIDHLVKEKGRTMQQSLGLSTRYLSHIMPILETHGLPRELAFLCLIESGYHHSARSHAGAVGMWQIIRSTSRRFDLVTDNWVDERRDFIKATEGAARFLSYLRGRFGDDWDHVLAAYNAGEGRVVTAVRKARLHDPEAAFSDLKLPRETRNYVPAFYAALLIALEPERYGLFPDYEPPLEFLEVRIPGGVPLGTVARQLGCALADLRSLNPAVLRDRVPFTPGGFNLKIPPSIDSEKAERVARNLSEITYVSYRVRKGDTLWDISRKFGVSISRISRVDRGRSHPTRIFPGEILLVSLTGKAG